MAAGLHLFVQPNGSKLWRMKYRFAGKEKLLSFGKYPDVPLAAARTKRDEARACLAEGRDPGVVQAQEQQAAERTFEKVARDWHANRAGGLNAAHAKRVISRMERDIFPAIGHRPLTEISVTEIPGNDPKDRGEGGSRYQSPGQPMREPGLSVCDRKRMGSGESTVHLLGALKPRPRVKHMARVPLQEVPDLVRAIAGYDGEDGGRRRDRTRDAIMFTCSLGLARVKCVVSCGARSRIWMACSPVESAGGAHEEEARAPGPVVGPGRCDPEAEKGK